MFAARGPIEPTELEAIRSFLTDRIESEMASKQIPSIAIGLYDSEGTLWADGFGAAREDGTPASRETVYRIGSVSKLFTDIAVMQRVERGELDLDAPITDVLPSFRPNNPSGTPITMRQLMCHRSGLVREPPIGNYFDDEEPSLAATVASLNSTSLVHEPGTVAKYSNAGIAVVGYVLETLAGKPFDQAMRDAVLDPLGMESSDFVPSSRVAGQLADAQMRTLDRRRFPAPEFQLGMAPAGSLYSTVEDLSRFTGALLRRETLLRPESLEEMFTPQFAEQGANTGYGLGFAVGRLDSGEDSVRQLGHGGAIYGFSTQLGFLPDQGLGVAIASSLDLSNGVIREIASDALKALLLATRSEGADQKDLGQFLTSREREETSPLTEQQIRDLAGVYAAGDDSLHLLARPQQGGGVSLVLRHKNSVRELKGSRSDTSYLVPDDASGRGTPFEVAVNGAGATELVYNGKTFSKTEPEPPPPAPQRFRSALGTYGWEHNPLFLFERDGELWALIEWLEQTRLREVARDTFAIDSGMYIGEQLTLVRDADGVVANAMLGPVAFDRREMEAAEGETFRIDPVSPVEQLRAAALRASPPEENGSFKESDLVELTRLDDSILLDVRYATTNNFMSAVFYEQARAFLQRPAAEALVRAHRKLAQQGYGLLIHDAYRPWYVTKMFWDATPEDKKIFVADPASGSRHNRGCAVDLTLYELATGKPIPMVGGYDEMTDRSFPDYLGGTERQRYHRELLRQAMESEGFDVYEFEWWHFDYRDWRDYGIQNKTFEQI